jgi:hypothetical protein
MPSKFHEILDDDYRTTSPECDVKLEDIIGAADLSVSSARSRTSSEISNGSNSSTESVNYIANPTRTDATKANKRRSRLLSLGRR